MLIWNILRDFFVTYFFGGRLSDGTNISPSLGRVASQLTSGQAVNTSNFYIPFGYYWASSTNSYIEGYISLGDWLSTTATIITLVIILVAIGLFIRWLFRLVSGLITLRG